MTRTNSCCQLDLHSVKRQSNLKINSSSNNCSCDSGHQEQIRFSGLFVIGPFCKSECVIRMATFSSFMERESNSNTIVNDDPNEMNSDVFIVDEQSES